jgi:O-Antigen ligase
MNTEMISVPGLAARPYRPLDRCTQRLAGRIAMLYAILVPLFVVQIGGVRFGFSDFAVPLTVGILLVTRPIASWKLPHLAMAVFLLVTFTSLFHIDSPAILQQSVQRWIRLVAMSIPLFLGLVLHVDEPFVLRVSKAFCWGGLFAIAIGLVVFWRQIPITDQSQRFWMNGGKSGIFRACGLVGETGAFGNMIAAWGIISLGWLRLGKYSTTGPWLLLGVLAVVFYTTVIASATRGAVVNFAVGGFALTLLSRMPRTSIQNFVLLGVLISALMVSALLSWMQFSSKSGDRNSIWSKSLERFLPSEQSNANQFSSGRLQNWEGYFSNRSEYFMLGSGYKTAATLLPGQHSDNAVLSIFLETGVPGLVCMTLFVVSMMWELFRRHLAGERTATVMIAAWIGQLITVPVVDIFTIWITMPVMYLLTGLVLQLQLEETPK